MRALAPALLVALLGAAPVARADVAPHQRAFWTELRARDFRLPAETAALPLALEAAVLLGSTDPELRDETAYEALASWTYRDRLLDGPALATLTATLAANARRGIGDGEGDGLFLRSFSLLTLAALAALDLKAPWIDSATFDRLLDVGIGALNDERDLRGWIPGKGWGHATAHAADLLKFLARNPRLTTAQQSRVVAAISGRLRSAHQVFVWGEDGRLAAALASLARRDDADAAPFEAWFSALADEHAAVWRERFDPVRYASLRAALNTLAELAADLEAEAHPGATQIIRNALRALRAATA